MRSRRIAVTIIVAAITVAACSGGDKNPSTSGGGSTTSSSRASTGRVSAAVISQCAKNGAAAATALEAYLKGGQTADQTVQNLDSAQRGLTAAASAATGQDPQVGQAMQTLSDAVGRAKAGIADGSLGPTAATKLVVDALVTLPKQYCE